MYRRTDEATSSSCFEVRSLVLLSSVYTTKASFLTETVNPWLTRGIGRARGLLELDLKLDDLLEMQKDGQDDLDLEYVQFDVSKVLTLLNRRFARKK